MIDAHSTTYSLCSKLIEVPALYQVQLHIFYKESDETNLMFNIDPLLFRLGQT